MNTVVMAWRLVVGFVAVVAVPAGAQTTQQPLTPSSHTFTLLVGHDGVDQGAWSIELKARNSENRIDVPAVVRFSLPADGFLRDTAFQLRATIGSKRERDSWLIQLPRAVTLSLSRVFLRRESLTLTLSPYATVVSKANARRGSTISAWFTDRTHDLSITAGVAQGPEEPMSTTLYANFGQTVTDTLRGVADVTYERGTGGDWIAASQALTYQVMPALDLALSSRQETSYAGVDKSVNMEVNLRLRR